MSGADIFAFLLGLNLDYEGFDWLEGRGLSEFEILASVILTQNTKWENVLRALANLRAAKISNLRALNALSEAQIATLIKPSGFYNVKARRLKGFISALLAEFKDLEDFKAGVSRDWLLGIKGLGQESVDAILNYLCRREILVIDSYTARLSVALGYEFEDYEALQDFFQSGLELEQERLCALLGKHFELYELYQIFHALITAFAKAYFKGATLKEEGRAILQGFLNSKL